MPNGLQKTAAQRLTISPRVLIGTEDDPFKGPTGGPGKTPAEDQGLTSEDLERRRRSELARKERLRDIEAGTAAGRGIFGGEALGRVSEERSADVAGIIEQRRAQLAGLEAPEFQALRETRLRGLQRGQQQQERTLRGFQGAAGIRGGLAGQQALQLAQQQGQQRQQAEQELLLQNVGIRGQALTGFQQAVGGAEASELQRQQLNQEALRRELLGIQTFALGEAALGAGERGAAGLEAIGLAQATATQQAGAQGGKK